MTLEPKLVSQPSSVMVPFSRTTRAPGELEYVEQALASGQVSGDGPFTRRASAWLRDAIGSREVLLTPSCTHALELAALVLEVGPGDEVVLPSFTFSSTANAFALRGAQLRFADIDPDTFSMELAQVEAALTPRTRVVVTVPYGGVMRDPGAIAALCQSRGIQLVEDAAHALFASHGGTQYGRFGELAALSFHQTKNVSCGEGGALLVNSQELVERALCVREKGTDRTRFLRGEIDKYTWRTPGSSYLLSDILAAVLVAQLEHSAVIQSHRTRLWRTYRQAFEAPSKTLGIGLQEVPVDAQHPAHVFAFLVPDPAIRGAVLGRLKAAGIQATSHYEPLHCAPAAPRHVVLPVTESVASRLVRLPLHTGLDESDALRCAEAAVSAVEVS